MATSDTKYRDLLPVIVETTGATMPRSFDSWGIKTVSPDLMTAYEFRWSMPGGTNISNDRLKRGNESACPKVPGDGLCVAATWRGMASGGIPARTLLLVAYRAADVVGRDDLAGKLRIGAEVATVALIDGERFIREHGKGANLRRSDLRGMILQGADLRDADLRSADLRGSDLQGADLQGADLSGADLRDADLRGAHLRGARLQGADLSDANLRSADLRGSDLQGADLQGADLSGADLRDADLRGAHLRGARLQGADLSDANLQNADLRGTDLQGADLQGADLSGANLRYADLRGSDLQGADLQGADLQGAIWPASIATPDGWTLTNDGILTRKATR